MSNNKSNLLYFFLFLLLNTIFCSCSSNSTNEEIVPNVYVNGKIYLNFHSELNSVGNALYFEEIEAYTGYLNHGFIIVRINDGYSAFDATCTHDIDEKEHVELDGVFAECPICKSKFNILDEGYPFDGSVARYPLKKYRTSYSSASNTLHIYN